MGWRRWIWAGLCIGLLAACHGSARSPEADAQARSLFDQLRQNQAQAIEARFSPQLRSPEVAGQLAQMHGLLPAGNPVSRLQVGTQTVLMEMAQAG